jgi:hypothetical protein
MARTTKKLAITASVKDEASGKVAKLSGAVRKAAEEQAIAEGKLVEMHRESSVALDRLLTPSKKVALAMQRQSAAADPLKNKLASLQQQRERMVAALTKQAKAGSEMDKAQLSMATQSQKSIAALKKEIRQRDKLAISTRKGAAAFNGYNRAAASSGTGVSAAAKSSANLGREVDRMPDRFGKASAALMLFQNASAESSGKVADAANKVGALGALMVTGGAFGIAMAAGTAAVAAGSAAWDAYTRDAKLAEAGLKAFADESRKARAEAVAFADELLRQDLEITHGVDRFVTDKRRQIETLDELSGAARAYADATLELIRAERTRGRVDKEEIANLTAIRAAQLQIIKDNEVRAQQIQDEIDLREQRKQKIDDERESTDKLREAEADRDKAKAARDKALAAAEAEELAGVQFIADARKRHSDEQRAARERRDAEELASMQFIADAREGHRKDEEEALKKRAALAIELEKEIAAERAAIVADYQEQIEGGMAVFASVSDEMFSSLADGSKTMSEAASAATSSILAIGLDAAREQIMAAAAVAAAKAFAANQALLGIGLVTGAAAAGVAFSATAAYAQKFATGGIVQGGIPGKDSVLIMAQQDEEIVEANKARKFRRDTGQTIGQALEGGLGLGGVTNVYQQPAQRSLVVQTVMPPTRTQVKELARMVSREMLRADAAGVAL